ncbi:tetratricopeptide repeat protein [Oceanispirochaeta crateris]|uniref:Tetratricopeptide repeat protein n=1 Tax=Oceanispirochaeta crateris TaxID=2518645 RepID=A0A5C1QLH1_9SPIO|nr:tetratricopeptide repeat protein [Oceanispirochaeta crateris]QEN07464.1 tetratricopeptide repeat protein [Oceanispirochaeta crateris]
MKKRILILLISCILTINVSAQSGTQLFQEGRDAFSDKLFSRSIESFRDFINQYPSDPRVDQADYMIGVSLFYLRKFDQVINHFDRYEMNYPSSAYLRRIHYWKGLSYYGQENFRSAIIELNQQSLFKEELYFRQKSLQLLGYSYEKTEQYELAGDSYKALFESDPGKELSALSLERQGYIQLKLKQYDKALDFFEKVTVEYSEIPQVMKEIPFYQAECYYQLKDYDNSLKKYESFLALYSKSENREKAVFRLGTLYALMNQQDDAKEYMNLLTTEYPDSSYIMDAHIILAESYMEDGDMLAARTSLTKLLEEEKDPVEIQKLQFNMGKTWDETPDEALSWYLKSSKGLDPDIAGESLYRSGVIYENKGEVERTVLLFEKLFNQYRNNDHREEVGKWMVNYYETSGQELALKNHLDRMLGEYPETLNRSLYLYKRGNLAYKEGKNNEALRYYQNILNVESEDTQIINETRYRIGYIYTLRKEFYRASDYFNDVLVSDKKDELYFRSLLSLGICYLNVKDIDEAEIRFKELTSVKPSTPWTADANFYLGQIQMDKGLYDEAALYFASAASSSENKERNIQSLYQLGWSYMRTASFLKASEAFDELWDLDSEHLLSGDSLYRSGTALSYLELWDESLIRYLKALDIVEFFSLREELLYQTAWSYFMLKDFDSAMTYLQQLEQEFPGSPLPADGLFRAAEALNENGNKTAAVTAYLILYHDFEENPLSETALYRALSLTENKTEKLGLIEEFLRRYSGNDRSLQAAIQLEEMLKTDSDGELELKEIEKILSLSLSDSERALIELGRVYPHLEDEKSLQILNDLSELPEIRSNEYEKIKLYRAIWHYHAGNTEQAEILFSEVLSGDSSEYSAEAQSYISRILQDKGEWKNAADAYLIIPYRYSDQTDWVLKALYEASLSYQKSGDIESYRRTAKMLLEAGGEDLSELFPDTDGSTPEAEDSDSKTDLESLSPSSDVLPLIDD